MRRNATMKRNATHVLGYRPSNYMIIVKDNRAFLTFVLTLSAMLMVVGCAGSEPAPEPAKDIFSSSTGMAPASTGVSPAEMADAMAESRAEQEAKNKAQLNAFENRIAKRANESEAEDAERDKLAAESDAKKKAEREDWLQGVKDSEAEAATAREAGSTRIRGGQAL